MSAQTTITSSNSTAAVAEAPAETKPAPGTGSEGQTFLVGDHLYLRAFELGDAKHYRAWRTVPYPITTERAEEILKKQIPNDYSEHRARLVAVRRADDVPVGMATYQIWGDQAYGVRVHADPGLGPATGAAIKAELLRVLIPWLLHERDRTIVHVDLDGGEEPVLAAARELGLRESARFRQAFWRNGVRRDHLMFEALHPKVVARLGDPFEEDAAISERIAAQRAEFAARPPSTHPIGPVPFEGDPPKHAVMVGSRIYLRPVEVEDIEQDATWSRREPETFFDDGRSPRSPISLAHWVRELAEADRPEWIRFAICLREGDTYIGSNGISDIDWLSGTAETESFIFRPEYRGGGYGTEAKHLLLAYAFETVGLFAVRSYVWGPNTRSAAALRKQGYRDAGIFHWSGYKNGEPTFDVTFDLLAEEWRAMRDASKS